MLSNQALKEILELVNSSDGSFIILEKDEPKLAILDFKTYQQLVNKTQEARQDVNSVNKNEAGYYEVTQKVLLTHAGDELSEVVVDRLVKEGFGVTVIADSSVEERIGVRVVHADFTDEAALGDIISSDKFDSFVHLHELSGHNSSLAVPDVYFINNVEAGIRLAKILVKHGVNKIIYRSSGSLDTPYSQTKQLYERILNFYHHSFGVSSMALRLPFVVGSKTIETGDISSLLVEDPFHAALSAAAGKTPYLNIPHFGELTADGTPNIEIISVADAADAIVFSIKHLNQASGSMVYRVDGLSLSIGQLIEEVVTHTGRMVSTSRMQDPYPWSPFVEDTLPSLSKLGWVHRDSLEDLISQNWPKYAYAPPPVSLLNSPELAKPISLSDLLAGKYTPFIKPHSS